MRTICGVVQCPLGERQPASPSARTSLQPRRPQRVGERVGVLAHMTAQAWREQSLPAVLWVCRPRRARSEDGDAVRHALDLVEVVRAEQHGAVLRRAARRSARGHRARFRDRARASARRAARCRVVQQASRARATRCFSPFDRRAARSVAPVANVEECQRLDRPPARRSRSPWSCA